MYIYGKSKQNFSFYFRFRFGHTTNKQNQTNSNAYQAKEDIINHHNQLYDLSNNCIHDEHNTLPTLD